MSWRLFSQIALLILVFFIAYYLALRVRDYQLEAGYKARTEEIERKSNERLKAMRDNLSYTPSSYPAPAPPVSSDDADASGVMHDDYPALGLGGAEEDVTVPNAAVSSLETSSHEVLEPPPDNDTRPD